MFRTSRAKLTLIRLLTVGAAVSAGTVVASTTLIGCKDESQPEYWVEKLEDDQWRPRAIKRLEQFYGDALTKANNDKAAPEVKAFLDKTVEPLTKTYTEHYGDLDTKTRVSLIKLLASLGDKRAEPAIKTAFTKFAERPSKTRDDSDIKWASRAVKELKLTNMAEPLLGAYLKLKASTMLGGITYRDMNQAMVAIPSKSWTSSLIKKLDAEIDPPRTKKDKDKIDPYRDQVFGKRPRLKSSVKSAPPKLSSLCSRSCWIPTKRTFRPPPS